jgi:hypothetical protein
MRALTTSGPESIDKSNGRQYVVEMSKARIISSDGDSGIFELPLRAQNDARTYFLRWRIDGEFDRYIGSTPHIPLSRPPKPFHGESK